MATPKKSQARRKSKSDAAPWRRSPIVGGIAALAIIFSIYSLTRGPGGGGGSAKQDVSCNDEACSYVGRQSFASSVHMPTNCPKCEKLTLYNALLCGECGKVTPLLPPWRNFSCKSCAHSEDVRLEPKDSPHPCPKCGQKEFYETYECSRCRLKFPAKVPDMSEFNAEGGTPAYEKSPMFGYEYLGLAICPKCNELSAHSISDATNSCKFCDSANLKLITPNAVLKYEKGYELKPAEEKIVEEWKARQ